MLFPDLRPEFTGTQLPETVVHLNGARSAVKRSAEEFLAVTYPTADVIACLKSVSADPKIRQGRPVVLKGERGRGKSHLMAVIHHAIESPDKVEAWAANWAKNHGIKDLDGLKLVRGFKPVTRAINDNEDGMFLWDVLFNNHSQGASARIQYEKKKSDSPQPAESIYKDMLQVEPTCLILDEFQTWFEGLPEKDMKEGAERRPKAWAFNTIQLLSQIAEHHKDHLILVVSVRTNTSEAFSQLQRVNPQLVDFGGPTALEDRRRLLQHRLFTNRDKFTESQITSQTSVYANERVRLRFGHLAGPEQQIRRDEVTACWPFSPELLALLEQQILLSQNAQETREAIKILAALSLVRGSQDALLTPADFHVDGAGDSGRALMTSIAQGDQEKLGEIARADLHELQSNGLNLPHARDILSSLWVRSLGSTTKSGAARREIQLDATRSLALDDNAFRAELTHLVDNSVHVHGEVDDVKHLTIGPQENPKTKVRVTARNDREWEPGGHYVGLDVQHLRDTVAHLLQPEGKDLPVRILVLGPNWMTNPWLDFADSKLHPSAWDKPVVVVLPDPPELHGKRDVVLANWLISYVQKHRNWVRFLAPPAGVAGLFADQELRNAARCSYLTSRKAWGASDPVYANQHDFFHKKSLCPAIDKRFNRFAVLRKWNFAQPDLCEFNGESIDANTLREKSGVVIHALESLMAENCFDPIEFEHRVVALSKQSKTIGDLLVDLEDPDPVRECLPYLGDAATQERLIDLVAANKIAIRSAGSWHRQPAGLSTDDARKVLRNPLSRTGGEQRAMQLGDPADIPGASVIPQPPPQPMLPPQPVSPVSPQPSGGPGPTSPDVNPPTPAPAAPVAVSRQSPASSKTSHLAWLEQQLDLPKGSPITATLTLSGTTPSQIEALLKALPPTLQPSLDLSWTQTPGSTSSTWGTGS